MISSKKIDELYSQYCDITEYLKNNQQITFLMDIDNYYKKALILSCAGFFELEIIRSIIVFTKKVSNNNNKLLAFIEKKSLDRQYHTLFDWKAQNANKFFKLFGDETKKYVRKLIDERELGDAEKAFMDIGRERNNIAHNFIELSVNNTFNEIYVKYQKACNFLDLIVEILGA